MLLPAGTGEKKLRAKDDVIRATAFALPLKGESVNCIITSPPYWGLRKYSGLDADQFGLEPTLELYIEHFEYGDGYSKKTYLWGKFNPPPKIHKVAFQRGFIEKAPGWEGNEKRKEIRSITPPRFRKSVFRGQQMTENSRRQGVLI